MPTDTDLLRAPRLDIRIDGQRAPTLAAGLVALSISEGTMGLSRCEAAFGNWGQTAHGSGYLYFDRQLIDFGVKLEIFTGDTRLFEGRVSALNGEFPSGHAPAMSVVADDRLQDLRMTRRTRTFHDASLADVITTIAGTHGLQAIVDLDGPVFPALAQLDQSDLSFLREHCRRAGAEIWVDGATLLAAQRSNRTGDVVTLHYGRDLVELTVSADLANQCTSLTVSGWDARGKQAVHFSETGHAISLEVDNHDTGAQILSRAFGDRPVRAADTNAATEDEARHLAEGMFSTTARRFVVSRGVSNGPHVLRVGTHVTLEGIGGLFSGAYYVAEVCHRYDSVLGFRTEFTAERAWLGSADS